MIQFAQAANIIDPTYVHQSIDFSSPAPPAQSNPHPTALPQAQDEAQRADTWSSLSQSYVPDAVGSSSAPPAQTNRHPTARAQAQREAQPAPDAESPEVNLPDAVGGARCALEIDVHDVPSTFIVYLQQRTRRHFRQQLNMHNTCSKKVNRGPVNNKCIAQAMRIQQNEDGRWEASLHFDNSVVRDDGVPVDVPVSTHHTKHEAIQHVCKHAFAVILLRGPWLMVLSPDAWLDGSDEIRHEAQRVQNLLAQPPPPGLSPRPSSAYPAPLGRESLYNAPQNAEQREQEQCELLRDILHRHGGFAHPFWLKHRLWQALDRLFVPGELRRFLTSHPEFEVVPLKDKRWAYRFARHGDEGAKRNEYEGAPSSTFEAPPEEARTDKDESEQQDGARGHRSAAAELPSKPPGHGDGAAKPNEDEGAPSSTFQAPPGQARTKNNECQRMSPGDNGEAMLERLRCRGRPCSEELADLPLLCYAQCRSGQRATNDAFLQLSYDECLALATAKLPPHARFACTAEIYCFPGAGRIVKKRYGILCQKLHPDKQMLKPNGEDMGGAMAALKAARDYVLITLKRGYIMNNVAQSRC